jgi:hypothetical protein
MTDLTKLDSVDLTTVVNAAELEVDAIGDANQFSAFLGLINVPPRRELATRLLALYNAETANDARLHGENLWNFMHNGMNRVCRNSALGLQFIATINGLDEQEMAALFERVSRDGD